jgi:putative transposase
VRGRDRSRPGPDRSTWAQSLRSQAQALLATNFIETMTLTGTRMYVLAVIEPVSRRVRILGPVTSAPNQPVDYPA